MSRFNTSQSIGDIVAGLPKAADVFKKFKIDFCCGGHRLLGEAISEQKLDAGLVLNELDKAYEEAQRLKDQADYREMPSVDLMDYIINTHHAFLNRNLPVISELVNTILRVHGSNHRELFQVHKLFHSLKTELEQHLIKEEELLFPMVREYEQKPSNELLEEVRRVARETEDEHESAGGILKELRKAAGNYEIPADVCGTFRKTYEMLQELESDLFQHIHLENNILFKRLGIMIQ